VERLFESMWAWLRKKLKTELESEGEWPFELNVKITGTFKFKKPGDSQ
jgi:hypothetical protein